MVGCLLALSLSLSGIAPQSDALQRFTYLEHHMGIDARIVVYAKSQTTAERACSAAFKRIGELDTCMSDYMRESELNRFCAKAGGPPVPISDDLYRVLQRSIEISSRSYGAFDITVGPLVQLWRASRRSGTMPDEKALKAARELVGWQKIRLYPATKSARLTMTGMKLDLGGIAKGYAGDEAQKELKKNGVDRALVELGGDIVLSGPPPGTEGWTIRVPNAGAGSAPIDMKLANCAISTSGDTEQFTIIDGKRYSHVVDPRSGVALTSRIQASVIAKTGFLTDPASKVVGMLGEKGREEFMANYPDLKAYVRRLEFGEAQ